MTLQGLLPSGTNYGQLISSLLTEQVAGFYDHTRKELHIADWLPSMIQGPVMAHEIFHAIQDQEWGGGQLIDSKKYTHDEVLAHAALLEGDATIVMFNYQQAGGGMGDISTAGHGKNDRRVPTDANVEPATSGHGCRPGLHEAIADLSLPAGVSLCRGTRSAGMSWPVFAMSTATRHNRQSRFCILRNITSSATFRAQYRSRRRYRAV